MGQLLLVFERLKHCQFVFSSDCSIFSCFATINELMAAFKATHYSHLIDLLHEVDCSVEDYSSLIAAS